MSISQRQFSPYTWRDRAYFLLACGLFALLRRRAGRDLRNKMWAMSAADKQRALNYLWSKRAELFRMAPIAPWPK